jgi:hypothetical protein
MREALCISNFGAAFRKQEYFNQGARYYLYAWVLSVRAVVGLTSVVAQRPTPPRTPDALPTSTHDNSANIGLISKAIKAMRLQELRDNVLASKYAAKYSVD